MFAAVTTAMVIDASCDLIRHLIRCVVTCRTHVVPAAVRIVALCAENYNPLRQNSFYVPNAQMQRYGRVTAMDPIDLFALLPDMATFVRVVDAGNFSEAARELGTTPSTVSRQIKRLEQALGTRLLERSTRKRAHDRFGYAGLPVLPRHGRRGCRGGGRRRARGGRAARGGRHQRADCLCEGRRPSVDPRVSAALARPTWMSS
ncbi:MAG: HTH-type transcriptional regulator ArgP [Burkholderia gladioli]|nr:MAG: HTH-type transcriptional regulator ArgP [Burkholderia gladioli]